VTVSDLAPTKMKLLDILTHAADEELLLLKPLPEHAAAGQQEHLRRHYVLLLAAVLTSQPTIAEAQTRLLRLLLDSLKLGDIRGELFEQARALEPDQLVEAARLIREAGLAEHLIVDALVLLRLEQPLSDEASRLAGELATLLGLDQATLTTRAENAADILGLGDAADAETRQEETDKQTLAPLTLSDVWPSALPQPLTLEALRQGIKGGVWRVDADLTVDFPWQAEGAVLLFRQGATLATSGKEVTLTGCHLWEARLIVQGGSGVNIQRCVWAGRYDPAAQATALVVQNARLTVRESLFQTRHARAIRAEESSIDIQHSQFDRCGHPNLRGGAVANVTSSRSSSSSTIAHCTFTHCQAARGGALSFSYLKGVAHCTFIACTSAELQQQEAGDIAVYAPVPEVPAIEGCTFRDTSLSIGNVDEYSSSAARVRDCRFIQSNVYYNREYTYNNKTVTSDCTFEGGGVIAKKFD